LYVFLHLNKLFAKKGRENQNTSEMFLTSVTTF